MPFTTRITTHFQIMEGDQFGTGGRTTAYEVGSINIYGADRRHAQIVTLSANLSAQQITLPPFDGTNTGSIVRLEMSDPVDIRLHAANDTTYLPGVRQLTMAGTVSALYITTGSTATIVHTQVVGGSNVSIVTSIPQS
jgi:hypothetical protein